MEEKLERNRIFPDDPKKTIKTTFRVPAEIQTEYLPSARLGQHGYTKLFCSLHNKNINNIIILIIVIYLTLII
jgi:hypothetical protein